MKVTNDSVFDENFQQYLYQSVMLQMNTFIIGPSEYNSHYLQLQLPKLEYKYLGPCRVYVIS